MRFPIHAFTFAVLGIVLAAPALADPTCKRLSDAQLAAALASADKSIEVVSEAALSPAISNEIGVNWSHGNSSLDAFFSKTVDVSLKSKDAQFTLRDAMDRGGSSLESLLEASGGVKPGSETSRMSAAQLLLSNRKRVSAMLHAVPRPDETQSEAFQAAVLDIKKAGNQFINTTTSLLAHYNCDAMASRSVSDHLIPGGACLDPPIPLLPIYGASVAPAQTQCTSPAAVSGQALSKPLLYSTPNGESSYFEGGSSSSGGSKAN